MYGSEKVKNDSAPQNEVCSFSSMSEIGQY